MSDIYLYAGEANPNDVRLSDPSLVRGTTKNALFEASGVTSADVTPARRRVVVFEASGVTSADVTPARRRVVVFEAGGVTSAVVTPARRRVVVFTASGEASSVVTPARRRVVVFEASGEVSSVVTPARRRVVVFTASGEVSAVMEVQKLSPSGLIREVVFSASAESSAGTDLLRPAYIWPNAPSASTDDVITSAQRNALATAFNVRLKSGLGDPTFRLWWKAYSLMREFRTGAPSATPAQDEWFSFYMHARPEDGDPEGDLNYGAPLPKFVFGEEPDIEPEDVLLGNIVTSGSTDAVNQWEVGKAQRGVRHPAGASNMPAFEAAAGARAFFHAHGLPNTSKSLSVWGGMLGTDPVPCEYDFGTIYRFVPVRGGLSAFSYSSCTHPGMSVLRTADRYVVFRPSLAPVQVLYSDFLLLANAGAFPSHAQGFQMAEVVNWFISGFRGSDAQRAGDDYHVSAIGFDFQTFFQRQYLLAPAKAYLDGETLVAIYPLFTLDATSEELPRLTKAVHGEYFEFDSFDFEGYSFAGWKITASGLTDPLTLKFRDKALDAEIPENGSVQVSNGSRVYWFKVAPSIDLEIVTQEIMPIGAMATIEVAPLERYKPGIHDAYTVLRRASCQDDPGTLDGIGSDYAGAKTISTNYFATGAIVNEDSPASAVPNGIGQNPIYETLRRTLRANHRLMTRYQFSDYEVEGGKAVLYFLRSTLTGGLDMWDGVAPPLTAIPSGSILAGVEYRVQGTTGTVTYNGVGYEINDTLTGVAGVVNYAPYGDAGLHQINGILTAAPRGGRTNEWTMFMSFATYDNSTLDPEDYADPLGFMVNRCMVLNGTINPLAVGPQGVLSSMGDSGIGSLALAPKIPSGYQYVHGCNDTLDQNFFKSCPVYPDDYEVERIENTGDGRVKLTFTGRFRSGPADITPGTAFRSDDNGLTDFLALRDSSVSCPVRTGDQSASSDALEYGACHPRFYFTKQIPRVYVDQPEDNDTTEPTDTRAFAEDLQWMHWVLDAMAPGYIDPRSIGNTGSCAPFYVNFTYESLNHYAYADRWPVLLNSGLRPDNPQSFGPIPVMRIYAEHFNALSSAVNALRHLPVILPQPMQTRRRHQIGLGAAPGHARSGPHAKIQHGSPSSTVSYGAITTTGKYDSWADSGAPPAFNGTWTDVSSPSGIGGAVRAFGGGYVDADLGVTVRGAIATYIAGSPCGSGYYEDLRDSNGDPRNLPPSSVGTENRSWFRLNPNAPQHNALSPAVLQLLGANGTTFVMLVQHQSLWAVNDPDDQTLERFTCAGVQYTGTFFGGRLRTYTQNDYECVSIPVGAAFFNGSGEGVELETKAGPPSSAMFSESLGNFGDCGQCVNASQVVTSVVGIGYAKIFVPSA